MTTDELEIGPLVEISMSSVYLIGQVIYKFLS